MADSKLNHHHISSKLTTWSLLKLLFTYTLVGSASKVASKATYTLVAQLVKNLPAMWETWVRSLGWEHPLEKRIEEDTEYRIL